MRERDSETHRESEKRGDMVRVSAHACKRVFMCVREKERARARA